MKNLIYSLILTGTAISSLILATSFGCGSPDQLGGGGNSGGGAAGSPAYKLDGSAGSKAGSGGGGNVGPLPTGDANCGSQTNSTTKQPADVLLVLDRSGSMTNDIAEECNCSGNSTGGGVPNCADKTTCRDRWSTVSAALDTTLTSTPGISWGLKLYSSGSSSCGVNPGAEVPIGANSAAAIQSRIASTSPANNTPTAAAITAATAYLQTVTDPNNKVILLATDGQPNCKAGASSSTTDVPGTVAAIEAAKAAGFMVYVIGIGPAVGNLDNFAQAGGTNTHYPATSPEQLATALASISTAVASCTFALATVPPDVNNVAVYVDKNLIKQNDPNGWSFGATTQTIVLDGSICEDIKSGKATSVQVLFGCPGIDPPKVIP